ncbi:MAG: glycerol kinase GlpK [Candidatus Actinomarina sp.]|nr:glycerol kinase GlpK [Candidatus Actinomarina sp.]
MKYFGSIDQGTTSSRFLVFDENGKIISQHQQELKQYLPNEVSVEHNPTEIWESVVNCIKEVNKNIPIKQLSSIGITNQRETTLAWSKSTGEPLHNALVWQDTRTQDICDELKLINELSDEFSKTGLPIATYFSLSKILWLLRNVEQVQIAKSNNDLCFGTIDSWLLYKLTGNHVTDVTNASRTLLMDLKTLNWIDKLLDTLDIPKDSLATIKPSMCNFGTNEKILNNVPITAVLGDQQASLFGHNCISSGDVKNTYGTGCFALTNTGTEIVQSSNGLLSTVAYQKEGDEPQYALEGSVSIAGAAVQWLRDNLNIIDEISEVESLAMKVKDNGDVYFVPAFSGLFSPHWDETARGVLVGLTRFSNKYHIARAVLESVAYQSFELLESMEKDTGKVFESVSVDGGMIDNNLLMQFQSDIFNKKVVSQKINEITALGVGAASYLYLNKLPFENMSNFITKSSTWKPNMVSELRIKYVFKWNKAISKAKKWI